MPGTSRTGGPEQPPRVELAAHREQARLLAHVVIAGTTEAVAMWLRGDLAVSREVLVERLFTLGSGTTRLIRDDGAGT